MSFIGTTSGWQRSWRRWINRMPRSSPITIAGRATLRAPASTTARGADQAAAALAFDRAARLYRIALEIHPGPEIHTLVLWKRLGDSLANAGRGAEAAQAYLKAAELAPATETLELKRLASTQLLISGHLADGIALLRTLLGPLGLSMPDTIRQASISLLWHRALLRLRGLRFRLRDQRQVSTLDLTRIDVCWSAVAGLSMIDPVRGADFQTRGLLLALKAGEPERLVRSIAMEAAYRSTAGTEAVRRVAKLLKTADELARQFNSPQARGMLELVRGISSLMIGRWKTAQTSLDQAEEILRNKCTGVAWERNSVHNFVLWALIQMGELAEVRRRGLVLCPRVGRTRGSVRDLEADQFLHDDDPPRRKPANQFRDRARARGYRESSRWKRFHARAIVGARFTHESQPLPRRHRECVGADVPGLA